MLGKPLMPPSPARESYVICLKTGDGASYLTFLGMLMFD